MPTFDLYSQSHNPTPAQLIKVCDDLMSLIKVVSTRPKIEDVLAAAETLAEQILAHYGTLAAASTALQPFCLDGTKLPSQVLTTLSYALMRDHPLLGVMLDEVYDLYGNVRTTEIHTLRTACNDASVMKLGSTKLWDIGGELRYQPASFKIIHPVQLGNQVDQIFKQGTSGIERLRNYYPQMNQDSRVMLDLELAMRVYKGVKPANDPVRLMLKPILDPVKEAWVKIHMMMDSEISSIPEDTFMTRLNLAFDFIDNMDKSATYKALEALEGAIIEFIERDDELTNDVDPVECMRQVLLRAGQHGFDPLPAIAKALGFDEGSSLLTAYLVDSIDDERTYDTTKSILIDAALLTMDEDWIIEQNLSPNKLGWMAKHTGSAKYRDALKQSDLGRDIVLGQDLGL